MRNLFITLVVFLLIPFGAVAQSGRQNSQSGEIILEQDAAKGDPYAVQQDGSIEFFKSLLKNIEGGIPARVNELGADKIQYLNAVYLYCTVSQGSCPTLLDALLEVDLINSRLAKTAQCPNLKLFWKLWIKTDMEQRQSYMVKTGFLNSTEEFKRSERPKYIKCEDTIKTEIAPAVSDSEFFKSRYLGENSKKRSIERSIKLLEEIKVKVPNVFTATGARG